jgi:hypothetical protein
MSLIQMTGSAEVIFTRVGPGKLFALAFAVLLLLVVLIIMRLLLVGRENGGSTSTSLKSLVDFGRRG